MSDDVDSDELLGDVNRDENSVVSFYAAILYSFINKNGKSSFFYGKK
jgi:hypothetical protein